MAENTTTYNQAEGISAGRLDWQPLKHVGSVFTGAASAHGDKDAANTYKIFTVTGVVAISEFWGVVGTTLVGVGGDISLGLTGNITFFANADDAPTWAAADLLGGTTLGASGMGDTTPEALGFAGARRFIVDGTDIVETTATADITGGQIDYYVIWAPLEIGASIVGAGTLSQV